MFTMIKVVLLGLWLCLTLVCSAFALTPQEQQANKELELMTKDIATLCSQPGFRGFLRSEMAKSKNREGIIELDKFLDRATKQKGMPPELTNVAKNVKDAKGRHKAMNLSGLEGFDLYIPVEAHKAKWKGGKDFIVAFAPYGDDQAYTEIIGFSVWDGKRVTLDPIKAPDAVVLAIVPEEHENHETIKKARVETEKEYPYTEVKGKEVAHKPVPQTPGNSYFGIRRIYLRDDKEPWTRGAAEIFTMSGYIQGNYCYIINWPYWSMLERVNYSKQWYTVWNANFGDNQRECDSRSTSSTCYFFDNTHEDKVLTYFYESDGGSRIEKVATLLPGKTCSWFINSSDDYVDHSIFYKTNMQFNYDYRQDMGNAIVYWHKMH